MPVENGVHSLEVYRHKMDQVFFFAQRARSEKRKPSELPSRICLISEQNHQKNHGPAVVEAPQSSMSDDRWSRQGNSS
jgi:hypothetical protein